MDDAPRYAMYFVPAAETDLYRFGSAVLRYDCYTGTGGPAARRICTADIAEWREGHRRAAPLRLPCHAEGAVPSVAVMHRGPARQRSAQLRRAWAVRTLRSSRAVQMLSGFAAVVPDVRDAGGRRAGRQMHDDLRRLSRADVAAGARAAARLGTQPQPDRKSRPLGLSVSVRRFPISHDADRQDRSRIGATACSRRCKRSFRRVCGGPARRDRPACADASRTTSTATHFG